MRRNKTIYCRANYDHYESACKSFSLTPDDYLCFNYSLKESDYYLPLNNQDSEQEDSSTRPIQLLTPNLSTSMIGPEVIFRMDVILGDTDLNLPLEFLRYALVNCPNLQRFLYKSTSNYNRSICIEAEPKMSGGIVKGKKKVSTATQKDIKVVKTGNMVPSKELLRLLHKYLPATEKLICGMNDFKDPPTELFEVDLIPFIHLKSVQLNVLLLCDEDQDTAYLELQFADRDCGYYCLKIDDPDLTVTKITLKQMKKQIGEANKSIRKAVIKCHKRVRFRLSYEYSMGVEICNGKNSIFYGGVNLELLYPHSF
ncbi:uncharacterized protein EV154DRAFT_496814 [Mucor mucedo]|uniref:uncharacterized protein n=1 Tax=Mucor mucedo TaxID=29922 RepID=UPI00221E7220|nr:uncharacterized protein EV154DRAFT_496814 [Mucor mucedo]KAI7895057.1 hypothetical protein EV154DRAFT_496814 [Mucor mucedo]